MGATINVAAINIRKTMFDAFTSLESTQNCVPPAGPPRLPARPFPTLACHPPAGVAILPPSVSAPVCGDKKTRRKYANATVPLIFLLFFSGRAPRIKPLKKIREKIRAPSGTTPPGRRQKYADKIRGKIRRKIRRKIRKKIRRKIRRKMRGAGGRSAGASGRGRPACVICVCR